MGGISLDSARVTDRGFEHDRRWMLVDGDNKFISQRTFPHLALFHVSIQDGSLLVHYKPTGENIPVPFGHSAKTIDVKVWDDECRSFEVSKHLNEWFSRLLQMKCELVYMPHETKRSVDDQYAGGNDITGFSDGYPFMMIGQSSLDDLNSRLEIKLPINRFRPNIVFTGGVPFQEDNMDTFTINHIHFKGAERCSRCVVTTIDQELATKGKEPLKTLATYRSAGNKIYFGKNLLYRGEGYIRLGDRIEVL